MSTARRLRAWSAIPLVAAIVAPASAQSPSLFGVELAWTNLKSSGIAAADFNGDGRLDLAAGGYSYSTNAYAILLNDGFGAYTVANVPSAGWPDVGRIQPADLNGDGRPEIVACDQGLRVLVNDGNGGFSTGATYSAGMAFLDLAIADYDDDGDLDVAASSLSTNSVVLHWNDGDGLLSSTTSFGTGASTAPSSLVALDSNVDGHLDLVVGRETTTDVAVFLGDGAGGFVIQQAFDTNGQPPYQVRVADIDANGALDLVVACDLGPGVYSFCVFLGNVGGGYQPIVKFAIENRSDLVLADLNGDGGDDVVSPGLTSSVFLSRGQGGAGMFAAPLDFTFSLLPTSLYASAGGDFDADGFVDLAIGVEGHMLVVRGNGTGTIEPVGAGLAGNTTRDVELGDVDGDGDLDAVAANEQSDDVSVLLGDGDGGLANGVSYSTSSGSRPNSVELGDVDGDGDLDVATANFINGTWHDVSLLLNAGDGTYGAPIHVAPGCMASSVELADVTGDAVLDLIVACDDAVRVSILAGDGSGAFASPQFVAMQYVRQVAVGDFNDDQVADLASTWFGYLSVALGLGAGAFAPSTSIGLSSSPQSIDAGDFDGDGDDDLALSDGTILESDGTGSFGPPMAVGLAGSSVRFADIDGDADLDVIAALGLVPIARIRAGDGQGGFASAPRSFAIHGMYHGAVGDLDGDGRADIVTAAVQSPGRLFPLLNHSDDSPTLAYCSAKANSQGCLPTIASSGIASAAAGSGFTVSCSNAINNKLGLLFYGLTGPANVAFSGGTLCVKPPVLRTPPVGSGGNPPPADCSGAYSIDFNAFIASGTGSAALQSPGTVVHAQWWGRDPQHPDPFKTLLSDALTFIVMP